MKDKEYNKRNRNGKDNARERGMKIKIVWTYVDVDVRFGETMPR